jgi:hypothetical protein
MAVVCIVGSERFTLEDREAEFLVEGLRRHDDFDISRLRRGEGATLYQLPNPDPPGDSAAAAILFEHALETREADRQPVVLDGNEGEYVMRLIGVAPLLAKTRRAEESPRLQALMNALSDHLGPWETPPWQKDE